MKREYFPFLKNYCQEENIKKLQIDSWSCGLHCLLVINSIKRIFHSFVKF